MKIITGEIRNRPLMKIRWFKEEWMDLIIYNFNRTYYNKFELYNQVLLFESLDVSGGLGRSGKGAEQIFSVDITFYMSRYIRFLFEMSVGKSSHTYFLYTKGI